MGFLLIHPLSKSSAPLLPFPSELLPPSLRLRSSSFSCSFASLWILLISSRRLNNSSFNPPSSRLSGLSLPLFPPFSSYLHVSPITSPVVPQLLRLLPTSVASTPFLLHSTLLVLPINSRHSNNTSFHRLYPPPEHSPLLFPPS